MTFLIIGHKTQKKDSHAYNIMRIFMFHQIFISPQVEQDLIISNKLVSGNGKQRKS